MDPKRKIPQVLPGPRGGMVLIPLVRDGVLSQNLLYAFPGWGSPGIPLFCRLTVAKGRRLLHASPLSRLAAAGFVDRF